MSKHPPDCQNPSPPNPDTASPVLPEHVFPDVFCEMAKLADDVLIVLDTNRHILWYNRLPEPLLAAGAGICFGRPLSAAISDPSFDEPFWGLFDTLCRHGAAQSLSFEFSPQKQPEKYYEATLSRIGGRLLYQNLLLLRIADHTQLHQLARMRSDFVDNLSHEMRTPLTVLMGYIETLLQSAPPDPKWQRALKLMNEQTCRMNNLVNDLLMLSKLEHDDHTVMTIVDMPKLLMQIFDDAHRHNQAHGHLLHIHLDTERNVLGNEAYLYSAIFNLVSNAIKYTPNDRPEQGEISIIWEETADGGLLSITDNGIGISPEHLPRLTERFYRVDSGRSCTTGGTGLGLSIVKHILRKHQAGLHIDSAPKQGASFKILFPKSLLR